MIDVSFWRDAVFRLISDSLWEHKVGMQSAQLGSSTMILKPEMLQAQSGVFLGGPSAAESMEWSKASLASTTTVSSSSSSWSSSSSSSSFAQLILSLVLCLALLIAGLAKLGFLRRRWWWSQRAAEAPLPPGRFGLPLVGETLELFRKQRAGKGAQFFDERVAKYGETFRTSILMRPTVALASPAGNKLAFAGVHTSWPASVLSVFGPDSLLAQPGREAARIRGILLMFLRGESLQRYVAEVEAITLELIASQLDELAPGGEHHAVVSLLPFIKKLTFSISCRIIAGRRRPADELALLVPFAAMTKALTKIPINFPGTTYSKGLAASKAVRKRLQVWIDERKRELLLKQHEEAAVVGGGGDDRIGDVLSGLVSYRDEHGAGLSDDEVADNVLLLITAGFDTSCSAASMACKYLAAHPAIMDDVYKENMEIVARKAGSRKEPLTWADTQKMKLSWRVVQETMRLSPPLEIGFRVMPDDLVFDGFTIPKSWKIMWSTNSTHRNPKYFPDPDKFDPSRFEGSGPAPFTFVPFGGGPRMCPGNEFARMNILIILHHLITRFSWTPTDPDEPVIIDPLPFPANGLPVLLRPRSSQLIP